MAEQATSEFRGIWVPYWEMTSAGKIQAHVDRAVQLHANALLCHVVPRGDAYYNSGLLPRAEALTDPDFDPLAVAVAAARAAGLQVHAWVNALLVWSAPALPRSPRHVVNSHRDWLMADPACVVQAGTVAAPGREYEGGYYLDPALPAVQVHLRGVCREILDGYDVDGIHFDYIRHPNRVGSQATRLSYLAPTLGAFHAETGLDPCGGGEPCTDCRPALEWTAPWDQWREDRLTNLVAAVAMDVRQHRLRPGARVSAATLARWDIGLGRSFTSGPMWAAGGALDFICPMCYFTSTEAVVHYTRVLLESVPADRVYAGLGAYLMQPRDLVAQIRAVRSAGAGGAVLFAAPDLDDATVRAVAGARGPWARPATPPAAGHRPITPPTPPPRPVPVVTLGTLEVTATRARPGLSRDFYVRRGRATLLIIQEGDSPLTGIELTVNGITVPVPDGAPAYDLSALVLPDIVRTYSDNHTSAVTIRGTGSPGARARFRVQDAY